MAANLPKYARQGHRIIRSSCRPAYTCSKIPLEAMLLSEKRGCSKTSSVFKFHVSAFLCQTEKCWNCEIPRDCVVNTLHCSNCKVLCAPPKASDFFELMEQPVKFDLDAKSLSKRYRQLQNILHPDRYSRKSDQELKNSESWSPLVNEAYSTLLDPLKRAIYILEYFGHPFLEGDQPNMGPGFLLEIMEINEMLHDASTGAEIDELIEATAQKLLSLYTKLSTAIDERDFVGAKIIVAQMQYFHNIKEKIKEKEFEMNIVR